MASISTLASGRRVVQVVDHEGVRKSISLGKVSKATSDDAGRNLQAIVDAKAHGVLPDRAVGNWLARLNDKTHGKIAKAGLAEPRAGKVKALTLATMIDAYIARRTDVVANTTKNYGQAKTSLIEFFGADKAIDKIARPDAEDYKRWALAKYARATVAMHIKKAKQFFADARIRKLIESNPFDGVPAGSDRNPDRIQFIDRATIDKVIDAAPNAEWRLLIALSRFGGLRVPSEPKMLKWADINWDKRRIAVTSPKTAKLGKGRRIIPLFPELEQPLREVFEAAPEGAEFVFGDTIRNHANLSTRFREIVDRAGVTRWGRLWHNLRASRANELIEQTRKPHVVAAWMGHDVQTAANHYLTATDDDFAAVTTSPPKSAAQGAAATGGKSWQPVATVESKTVEKAALSPIAALMGQIVMLRETIEMPSMGVEPTLKRF